MRLNSPLGMILGSLFAYISISIFNIIQSRLIQWSKKPTIKDQVENSKEDIESAKTIIESWNDLLKISNKKSIKYFI